jgi:hypothetical protein
MMHVICGGAEIRVAIKMVARPRPHFYVGWLLSVVDPHKIFEQASGIPRVVCQRFAKIRKGRRDDAVSGDFALDMINWKASGDLSGFFIANYNYFALDMAETLFQYSLPSRKMVDRAQRVGFYKRIPIFIGFRIQMRKSGFPLSSLRLTSCSFKMAHLRFIRFKRTFYILLSSLFFSIREFEEDMRDSRESLQPLKLQALSGI